MQISVNGARRDIPEGATVATLLTLLDVAPDARGVAVALDGEVVTRGRWTETEIADGSQIEVVAAIQGG